VPRVEETRDRVSKVYGYFNNHYHGYAVENCIEILEMLNAAETEQVKVKERVLRHNREKQPLAYERKYRELDYYLSEPNVEDLLLRLTDEARIDRGREIKDEEISIEESSGEKISAKVKEYMIELSINEKVLRHDCDDWRKGVGIKRLCKHIAKFFMTIPPREAKDILKDMIESKDDWAFQLR